jgi:hypothetical protein
MALNLATRNGKSPWKSLIGGDGSQSTNKVIANGVLLSFNGLLLTIMLCVVACSITIQQLVNVEENILSNQR